MTAETLLRLALVPAAVWLASLAGRRWGHGVSGYLGGLPMIGGPITLFLALDLGVEFATRSALVTLGAIAGQGAHLLAFAHAGRHGWGWMPSLAAGWAGFGLVACLVTQLPLNAPLALALAVAGLAAAHRWLPRPRQSATLPAIPPAELRLRLLAALGLAALILWAAPTFGPAVSGVLLSWPVTGSIMPPFTLALYGPDAVARMTRGFVVGLSGFTLFFLVLSTTLVAWGIALSFAVAVVVALGAVFAVNRIVARSDAKASRP